MSGTGISLVKTGSVGELVLNRPLTHNAISRAMWRKIPALLGEAQSDPNLRSLIVHGGEAAAFSAGANIAELSAMADDPAAAQAFFHDMSIALETLVAFPKPVIARIKGPCIGAGMALAMACDIRIAAKDARFGVTPAKLGLVYPLADTRRLVALIGPARAKDLIFSARLIGADEALRLGLIEHIVGKAELAAFTRNYVHKLGERSAHTQNAMKTMINTLCDHDPVLALQSRDVFVESFSGKDFHEGFAAFAQKRNPDFS